MTNEAYQVDEAHRREAQGHAMKLVKKLSPIGENHQHSATRNVGDVGSIDLLFSSFVKYDLCISYEMWRMTGPSQEVANATLMFHGITPMPRSRSKHTTHAFA